MTQRITMFYVMFPSHGEAVQVAHEAIQEKQAACVHILPTGTSVYEWEGRLEQSSECMVLFKIPVERRGVMEEWVRQRHPYSVPAFMIMDVETTDDFHQYVEAQVRLG